MDFFMTTTTSSLMTGSFIVDPIHSNFGFSVAFQGVSVFRGSIDDVGATLVDGKFFGSAQVESISIRRPQQFRDHILGPEFFDAAKYPQIEFVSTRVELRADGRAVVVGDATMKGRTKPVEAHGTWREPELDAAGRTRGHLHVEAVVDRRDFGLSWNAVLPSGIAALGHEVTVTIEASLVERAI
jgi:polyisoprenoid-binding protein YceI